MNGPGRWSDLGARIGSAVVMAGVGLLAMVLGGAVFHLLVALVCGAMVWELVRMLAPDNSSRQVQLGLLAAGAVLAAVYLPGMFVLPVLLAPALVAAGQVRRRHATAAAFVAFILLAGYEMTALRDAYGFGWLLWLVLVVMASDVAGYFAGRRFGGPKFWPRVSPKKTWSGTVAGWAGAALVGLAFAMGRDGGMALVGFSVLTALAAQMGDIAESAVKRMVGVKDSSALIPGHGGLLDRFDGMLGASVFVLLVAATTGLPFGAM